MSVAAAMERLWARVADAGGDPERITLVAVTKAFGPDIVGTALAAGLADLGENYAQELLAKAGVPGADTVRWHFVGRLQRNKVRTVAHLVHLWQSVDRLSLAEEVARRAPGARVLVQVNSTDEPQKGGCQPAFAAGVVEGCRDLGLEVRGLMTVGPTSGPPEAARASFRLVRELADGLDLTELSMGMTGDLEAAVAEGSTMIRVGTAIFGPRPVPP